MRLIYQGGQEKWSDLCKTCGHSRGDHMAGEGSVPLANPNAVGRCNHCTVGVKDYAKLDKDGKGSVTCGCANWDD